MHIRLMGTADECSAAAEVISNAVDVLSESVAFPNRNSSRIVRVYLTARVLADRESTTEKGNRK